jgi:hypothetical protein
MVLQPVTASVKRPRATPAPGKENKPPAAKRPRAAASSRKKIVAPPPPPPIVAATVLVQRVAQPAVVYRQAPPIESLDPAAGRDIAWWDSTRVDLPPPPPSAVSPECTLDITDVQVNHMTLEAQLAAIVHGFDLLRELPGMDAMRRDLVSGTSAVVARGRTITPTTAVTDLSGIPCTGAPRVVMRSPSFDAHGRGIRLAADRVQAAITAAHTACAPQSPSGRPLRTIDPLFVPFIKMMIRRFAYSGAQTQADFDDVFCLVRAPSAEYAPELIGLDAIAFDIGTRRAIGKLAYTAACKLTFTRRANVPRDLDEAHCDHASLNRYHVRLHLDQLYAARMHALSK